MAFKVNLKNEIRYGFQETGGSWEFKILQVKTETNIGIGERRVWLEWRVRKERE